MSELRAIPVPHFSSQIASPLTVIGVLWRREMVRLIRQPVRVAAVLGTAGMIWIVLGSGFADSFSIGQKNDLSYSAFLLPGVLTLAAMFTAIFSSISVIEDRNGGWLQSVLISPGPRWSLAIGQCAGGATVAFVQSAILLPALAMTELRPGPMGVALALLSLALTSIALSAVGLLFAWRCETSAGYHAVMNLVFLPMWALSGSMFPTQGAATWLAWLMKFNPLTWCTNAVRGALTGNAAWFWIGLAAVFAAIMIALATAIVARPLRAPP